MTEIREDIFQKGVFNLKLKPFLKRFYILQFLLLFLLIHISLAVSQAKQDIKPKFVGTWLYLWWHGNVSVGNEDGATTERTIFTPESYGEAVEQKSDTFIRFREDGTGTFFRRHVILKNNDKILTVITQDPKGAWIEKDVLALRYDFIWKIKGNKLIINAVKEAPRFNYSGKYDFSFNETPTRPAGKEIQKRFGLKDELIIYMFGLFLRLGESAEEELNKRYNIL